MELIFQLLTGGNVATFVTSSGLQSASAVISDQPGGLAGVDLYHPDQGYCIVTLYDSNTTDTTNKNILGIYICYDGMNSVNLNFPHLINVTNGIYAVFVSDPIGLGVSNYIVRYIKA